MSSGDSWSSDEGRWPRLRRAKTRLLYLLHCKPSTDTDPVPSMTRKEESKDWLFISIITLVVSLMDKIVDLLFVLELAEEKEWTFMGLSVFFTVTSTIVTSLFAAQSFWVQSSLIPVWNDVWVEDAPKKREAFLENQLYDRVNRRLVPSESAFKKRISIFSGKSKRRDTHRTEASFSSRGGGREQAQGVQNGDVFTITGNKGKTSYSNDNFTKGDVLDGDDSHYKNIKVVDETCKVDDKQAGECALQSDDDKIETNEIDVSSENKTIMEEQTEVSLDENTNIVVDTKEKSFDNNDLNISNDFEIDCESEIKSQVSGTNHKPEDIYDSSSMEESYNNCDILVNDRTNDVILTEKTGNSDIINSIALSSEIESSDLPKNESGIASTEKFGGSAPLPPKTTSVRQSPEYSDEICGPDPAFPEMINDHLLRASVNIQSNSVSSEIISNTEKQFRPWVRYMVMVIFCTGLLPEWILTVNLAMYLGSGEDQRVVSCLLRDTWYVQTIKLSEAILESVPQIHLKIFYYLTRHDPWTFSRIVGVVVNGSSIAIGLISALHVQIIYKILAFILIFINLGARIGVSAALDQATLSGMYFAPFGCALVLSSLVTLFVTLTRRRNHLQRQDNRNWPSERERRLELYVGVPVLRTFCLPPSTGPGLLVSAVFFAFSLVFAICYSGHAWVSVAVVVGLAFLGQGIPGMTWYAAGISETNAENKRRRRSTHVAVHQTEDLSRQRY